MPINWDKYRSLTKTPLEPPTPEEPEEPYTRNYLSGTGLKALLHGGAEALSVPFRPLSSAVGALTTGIEALKGGERIKPTGETFLGFPQYEAPSIWQLTKENIQEKLGEPAPRTLEDERMRSIQEAGFAKAHPKTAIAESVAGVAGEMATDPINLLFASGTLPKAASKFFAAQMALGGGAGLTSGVEKLGQEGLTPESAAELAGGAASLAFAGAAGRHGFARSKKPAVAQAAKNAQAEQIKPLPDVWEGEAPEQFRMQGVPEPTRQLGEAPQADVDVHARTQDTAQQVLGILQDYFPHQVREVIVSPQQRGMGITPDGTRIVIGGNRIGTLLEANDAAGVVDNLATFLSHEVLHPGQEAARFPSGGGLDPMTGQPTGRPLAGEAGHAVNRYFDDRTQDLSQIFQESQLLEQLRNDPRLKQLAGTLQQTNAFSGVLQPARPAGEALSRGTYDVEMLRLARDLGEMAGEVPEAAKGFVDMNAAERTAAERGPQIDVEMREGPEDFDAAVRRGALEQAELEGQAPEAAILAQEPAAIRQMGETAKGPVAKKFEEVTKPESLMDKIRGLLGQTPKAKAKGGRPPGKAGFFVTGEQAPPPLAQPEAIKPPPGPMTRALTGQGGPAFPALSDPNSAIGQVIRRINAPRDARAQFKLPNMEVVLRELEARKGLRKLGLSDSVAPGELWPVYNNIAQAVRKMGGVSTPAGKKLWDRLQSVVSKNRRVFNQHARAQLVAQGVETPRQLHAYLASQERAAQRLTPTKAELAYTSKQELLERQKAGAAQQRPILGELRAAAEEARAATNVEGFLAARDKIMQKLSELNAGQFLSNTDRLYAERMVRNLDKDAFAKFGEAEGEAPEKIRQMGETAKKPQDEITKWRQNVAYREGAARKAEEKAQSKRELARMVSFQERYYEPSGKTEPAQPKAPTTKEQVPSERLKPGTFTIKEGLKTGEEPAPGVKIEPKVYAPTERGAKRIARKVAQPEPLHAAAGEKRADRAALENLLLSAKKGETIDAKFLDKLGLSEVTKSRVRTIFHRTALEGGDYKARTIKFIRGLGDVYAETLQKPLGEKLGPGQIPEKVFDKFNRMVSGAERVLEESAKRSKEPLEKEFYAAKPSTQKMSPLAARKGPWTGRKSVKELTRDWVKEGVSVQDKLGSLHRISLDLSESLGLKVSPELLTMVPAGEKTPISTSLSTGRGRKFYSSLEALQGLAKRILPLADKKIASLRAEGKEAAAEALQKKTAKLRENETLVQLEGAQPGEIKAAPRLLEKFEKLPPSMEPSVTEAGKTGKMGRKLRAEDEVIEQLQREREEKRLAAEEGRGMQIEPRGVKTSRVGLSDKFAGAEKPVAGAVYEAKLEGPRIASAAKLPPLSRAQQLEKAAFVKRESYAAGEAFDLMREALTARGHLRTPAENEASIGKGRPEYPELFEELSLGREFDPNQEYWIDPKKLAQKQKFFENAAAKEWENQREEAYRASLTKRVEIRKGEIRPPVELSPEVKQLLKDASKDVSLMEAPGWVERQIVTGEIPPAMQADATYQLRRNIQAKEKKAGRKVRTTALSKEEAAERFAIQYEEKLAPPSEKIRQMGETADKKSELAFSPEEIRLGARQLESMKAAPKEIAKVLMKPLPAVKKLTAEQKMALHESFKSPRDAARFRNMEPDSAQSGMMLINWAGTTANMMRPFKTMWDVSNPFRQTLQLTADQIFKDVAHATRIQRKLEGDPSFAGNVVKMLKTFATVEGAKAEFKELEAHPMFEQAQRMGVRFATELDPVEGYIGKNRIQQLLRVLEHGPAGVKHVAKGVNWGLEASERSYNYYQNKAMLDGFTYGLEALHTAEAIDPVKFKLSQQDYKDLVNFINKAGSRHQIPLNDKMKAISNYMLYSGQMLWSRGSMLKDVATGFSTYSPAARQYARAQTLRAISAVVAMNGLVYAAAALQGKDPKVETDPRSVDFGKVKVGNIVHDFGGGWFQLLRATTQTATGEVKSKETGLIQPQDRAKTVWSFLETKLAPGVSTLIALNRKKTAEGAPIKPGAEGLARLIFDAFEPMSVNDAHMVFTQEPSASWLIPLMLLGTGIQEDVRAKSWEKGKTLELSVKNREELRMKHVPGVKLPTEITLPGKDVLGRKHTYKMTPAEREAFEAQYMPLVTQLLNDFINSKAYQSLPESKKSAALRRRVHLYNQRYSPNVRARREYTKKFKAGEIKPTNVVPEE